MFSSRLNSSSIPVYSSSVYAGLVTCGAFVHGAMIFILEYTAQQAAIAALAAQLLRHHRDGMKGTAPDGAQVGAYPFEDPQYPNSDIRTFQACALPQMVSLWR